MKKYIIILFAFIGSFVNAQGYDFQQLCLDCAEANGFYCGDDPANWAQYSPMGCVQTSWINDGWEDCVDASDENEAEPTSPEACAPPPQECDTVFVEIPIIQYEYIFDTIVEYETVIEYDTIVETEYIYNTDTVYADVLDTMFIDVIEYVEIFIIDTIVEIQYEEVVEYIDCSSGLPCNSGMQEIIDKSLKNSVIYNLQGQAVLTREGLYIENGKIYYKTK